MPAALSVAAEPHQRNDRPLFDPARFHAESLGHQVERGCRAERDDVGREHATKDVVLGAFAAGSLFMYALKLWTELLEGHGDGAAKKAAVGLRVGTLARRWCLNRHPGEAPPGASPSFAHRT